VIRHDESIAGMINLDLMLRPGSDNDSFLKEGYPAFLVIENSDPDWKLSNPYVHHFEDA